MTTSGGAAQGREPDREEQAAPVRPSWWQRHRDDLSKDAVVSLVVGMVLLAGALYWDTRLADRQDRLSRELNDAQVRLSREIADRQDRIAQEQADRAEVLENVRFVRQLAVERTPIKPFASLNLQKGDLGALNLGCVDQVPRSGEPPGPGPDGESCSTDLDRANLREATLRQTNLQNALLSDSDLCGADMQYVDITGGSIPGANLTNAVLADAELEHIFADDANLSRADLRYANLRSGSLVGARLPGADLRFADLRHADLSGANLAGAKMRHAKFRNVDLAKADLVGADLSRVDLSHAKGLRQPQIDAAANGNLNTALPKGLRHPAHWSPTPRLLPDEVDVRGVKPRPC